MQRLFASVVFVATMVAVSGAATARLGKLRDISQGQCPNITNKQDFDPVPYLGTWYEIERFEVIFEAGMDCVQAIYSDLGEGEVGVRNVARTSSGESSETVGTATVKEPGVLSVVFPGYIAAEYHVLDTDYTTFSAVFNCDQVGPERLQYAWVLSRTPSLDTETYEHARAVFDRNGIELNRFHTTFQSDDCPYVI